MSNPTPTFGDTVSYTKPLLAKGDAPKWRVRSVDPDGTLILDLIGGRRGRSTARFGVDPGKVTVRSRQAPEQSTTPPPLKEQGKVLRQRYLGAGRFMEEEDPGMTGASVVPVQAPTFEVMSADHHRNGVSGRGFYVGIVKHWGDCGEGEEPRLLQVIAAAEDDAPEDVTKITFDNGSGVEVYVTDLMVVAKQGTVAFGRNSFRGDNFVAEARAIVIQTRAQWDNQMLALRR